MSEEPVDEVKDDIYGEKGREGEVSSDSISPEEEGFMKGYEEGEKAAKCAHCGKVLGGGGEIVEKEIKGEVYRFCCNTCAENFKTKRV